MHNTADIKQSSIGMEKKLSTKRKQCINVFHKISYEKVTMMRKKIQVIKLFKMSNDPTVKTPKWITQRARIPIK